MDMTLNMIIFHNKNRGLLTSAKKILKQLTLTKENNMNLNFI